MADTLIIIGNGFDRHCHLKSSYEHFFNYLCSPGSACDDFFHFFYDHYMKRSSDTGKVFSDFINAHRQEILESFTVWDMLFLEEIEDPKNKKWCNIESKMLESLVPIPLSEAEKTAGVLPRSIFWEDVKDILKKLRLDPFQSVPSYLDLSSLSRKKILACILQCKFTLKIDPTRISFNPTYQDFYSEYLRNWDVFLLNQLHLFENKFRDYLKQTVENTPTYHYESDSTISMIIDLVSSRSTNLMSFNYTECSSKLINLHENVHGICDDESGTIFGIDSTSSTPDDFAYVFTKTFRKVKMYTENPSSYARDVLDKGIEKIIFYGHSLNKQDYSYFQSIFDFYKLYENEKMHLLFLYSLILGIPEEKVKMDVEKSVSALINEYGKTLDNVSQGQNLMHKLLITGRLEIKSIS